MIDKQQLQKFIENTLDGSNCFLVDLTITSDNIITVEIDSMESIDIDTCINLTRKIETAFDRDKEDYELEVGSCGLTAPLKVLQQYKKNLGNKLDILTTDGGKHSGVLMDVKSDGIEIEIQQKVKHEGQKRPSIELVRQYMSFDKIKKAVYHFEF